MNNEEIWKDIIGYEGFYQVSSLGRVRSLDMYVKCGYGSYRLRKGKVLSSVIKDNGYLQLKLYCNGKLYKKYVHRLVAQAFIPNPDNLPEVNHLDEDKTNNNVTNLEWCDHKYNLNYGTARIRERDTKMKNGWWSGLSKKEYRKKYYEKNKDKIKEYMKEYSHRYYQENKDRICEQQKEYYRKKKEEIQNNVKSLDDQI